METNVTNLQQFFNEINKNFDELNGTGTTNLITALRVLNRVMELEMSGTGKEISVDVSHKMLQLLSNHCEIDFELTIVLQILYQILKTLKGAGAQYFVLRENLFHMLVDRLHISKSTTLRANILECLLLCVRNFNGKYIIERLWSRIVQTNATDPCSVQTLVHLFDEFALNINKFFEETKFIVIVEALLMSESREGRRSAYFLLRKMLEFLKSRSNNWEKSTELGRCWATYITIMENLEENQSHLILPSLETLRSIDCCGCGNRLFRECLCILYSRLFSHGNILVIRWTLDYFLETRTCVALSPSIFEQFLAATNKTQLYNIDGYFLLQESLESRFLKCDCSSFLEALAKIDWKSVPLHFWLTQLRRNGQLTSNVIQQELLLRLAARVRVLQNPAVRRESIGLFENIFSVQIENMQLEDYVKLVETLYNLADRYKQHAIFTKKLKHYACQSGNEVNFSRRIYEILSVCSCETSCSETLVQCLASMPTEKHGWLRFYVAFDIALTTKAIQLCHQQYGLDLIALPASCKNLANINSVFCKQLIWQHSSEMESFVHERALDFFAENYLLELHKADEVMELLECGSPRTLYRFSKLLAECSFKLSPDVLETACAVLRSNVKNSMFDWSCVKNIVNYCHQHYSEQYASAYCTRILNIDLENSEICRNVLSAARTLKLSKELCIRGMLLGDIRTGDARIEEMYYFHLKKHCNQLYDIRRYYRCHFDAADNSYLTDIVIEMFTQNAEISRKKPRYYENSMEHRRKIRIAHIIFWSSRKIKLPIEQLWHILLQQNNQLNITYIYELLTAEAESYDGIVNVLSKMHSYTASQQVSIISIIYAYCILHLHLHAKSFITQEQVDNIIAQLFPLIMGANFQVRLFAQLSIVGILEECAQQNINMSRQNELKEAIKTALGDQLAEKMTDVRIKMPYIWIEFPSRSEVYDVLLHLTNAPVEEYNVTLDYAKYAKLKRVFTTKSHPIKHHEATQADQLVTIGCGISINNFVVQRKMNPTNDLLDKGNLISSLKKKNHEMFVVASLVDKAPNLGGLARTCEVLGIQNLVVDCKSQLEKSDFKSLSMTAEKSLTVLEVKSSALGEFLMIKQAEGFSIIGAEQTANSVSFAGFRFPRKCILILGHEKEGIPANLMGFLHTAVEIPQFGQVRSLNVHVTGALFMWEYCKQHII